MWTGSRISIVLFLAVLAGGWLRSIQVGHTDMLQNLAFPYQGPISVSIEDTVSMMHYRSSIPYTMQPGDILVGLREYGLWNPYPEIFADGQRVEPFELLAGTDVINYVYSTGDKKQVQARYTSDFGDTVTMELIPYRYSQLNIDPGLLDKRANYRQVGRFASLHIGRQVQIATHSMGCFGGAAREVFSLKAVGSYINLRYQCDATDTTVTVPVPFELYASQIRDGIREVKRASGGCVQTLFYDVKAGNNITRLADYSCEPSMFQVIKELRHHALSSSQDVY